MSADDLFLGYIPKNFNDDGKTTCLMVGAMVVTELFFTVLVIVTAPKGVKAELRGDEDASSSMAGPVSVLTEDENRRSPPSNCAVRAGAVAAA